MYECMVIYILCYIVCSFPFRGQGTQCPRQIQAKGGLQGSNPRVRLSPPFFPHAFPFLHVPLPYASALFPFPFLSVCLIMYFHTHTHTTGFPFHAMTEEQMLRPGFPCSALISNLCSRNLMISVFSSLLQQQHRAKDRLIYSNQAVYS